MSFLTGTQTELIASQQGAGSVYTTSTTATIISGRSGAAYLPPNFFSASYGVGKALKFIARGVVTWSSTTANLTLGVYGDTTTGTIVTGNNLASSAVIATPTTAVSGVIWEYEADVVCTAISAAGVLTFQADGLFTVAGAGGTSYVYGVSNSSTTMTLETGYWAEFGATWGTNSASYSITCNQFFTFGLN